MQVLTVILSGAAGVLWMGTEVEGGYLVREKDFRALERDLKRLMD